MNYKNSESMDFTETPRIQKDGWNYGKQTIKKKVELYIVYHVRVLKKRQFFYKKKAIMHMHIMLG